MRNGRRLLKLGLLALSITLVVAITFAVNGMGTAGAGDAATAPELEGTWLATLTPEGGPPPFVSLVTYARGGALTVTDGGVAPALGNVYQGTWTKTGAHEYTFTFLGLQYNSNGAFSGYLRAHETLVLAPGGQSYDGFGTVEGLDTEWNVLWSGANSTHATRVDPQLAVVGDLHPYERPNTWCGLFKITMYDASDPISLTDTGAFELTWPTVEPLE